MTFAQVAFLPLPAGSPVIAADETAGIYKKNTPAEITLAENTHDSVKKDTTLFWGFTWQYDGCKPMDPATSCKKTHCLDTWKRSRKVVGVGAPKYDLGKITKAHHDKQK